MMYHTTDRHIFLLLSRESLSAVVIMIVIDLKYGTVNPYSSYGGITTHACQIIATNSENVPI